MTLPLSVRLDPNTWQKLKRIACRERLSISELVRHAIEAWMDAQEPITAPYDVVADLLGVVRSGKADGSAQTGRRFAKLLKGCRILPDSSH